ncbi:MAG: hypothetical protein CSB47_10500 [Proteobacteria bacterium]|nr:MAG: hypothetical protein CSB47_10500 [Pseudomonadota bacterium]
MFIYALKISGMPQDKNVFERLKLMFGISDSALQAAIENNTPLIINSLVRNGELFFEHELKEMGQSFTELSRAGLSFVILRQRYNGEFKPVADYTAYLKIGRKAWREEKIRVDATSESLESFLHQEANSEDMEVLRPLFPANVNKLLRDSKSGIMKGSEVLQKTFPSMKRSDARRIFYQMQLLFEERADKWKSRAGCAWVSIYFLMAVLTGYATYDWLTTSLSLHGLVAAPLAFVLSILPLISSVIAYITATSLWGWSPLVAFIGFFWYYLPILYLLIQLIIAVLQGDGEEKWEQLIGCYKAKPVNKDSDD